MAPDFGRFGRAKFELEAERQARLDSEDATARLREELQQAKVEQTRHQRNANEQLSILQSRFQSLSKVSFHLPHNQCHSDTRFKPLPSQI
jgi:hypothetical protein